jgi:hypothetical protein
MPSKQSPSPTLYVVDLKEREPESIARRVGSKGSLEEVKGRKDLMLLRMPDQSADPRTAWEHARKTIGDGGAVQPVLLDPDGKSQLPTGEVSVRFRETPSDEQLERFAHEHGLRLLHRNEFVPQQAVFGVVQNDRYLPDLVDELSASDAARLAWANTIAGYERQ